VALALLSSFRNKAMTGRRVVFGELGLAGEVRPVADAQGRIREAVKLGFKGAITPRGDQLQAPGTFQITSVLRLGDAMDDAFSGS
jgi:DNA repair protein RadA/Sms